MSSALPKVGHFKRVRVSRDLSRVKSNLLSIIQRSCRDCVDGVRTYVTNQRNGLREVPRWQPQHSHAA